MRDLETSAYDASLGGDTYCNAKVTVRIIFGGNVDTVVRDDICPHPGRRERLHR